MDGVIFKYFPGKSLVHSFDPRFKIPGFAFFCFSVFRTGTYGLIPAFVLVVLALFLSGIPLRRLAADFLKFLPLLLLFFVAVFFSETVEPSLNKAFLASSRFCLLIILGNLLIQTTSLSEITAAVNWYLKPFPFINGNRIAVMTGLSVSLIPRFFQEYEESRTAVISRCLSPFRHPFRWGASVLRPFMTRIFISTEDLSLAMEARCFSDNRTGMKLHFRISDCIMLVILLGVSVCILML